MAHKIFKGDAVKYSDCRTNHTYKVTEILPDNQLEVVIYGSNGKDKIIVDNKDMFKLTGFIA